MSQVLPLPSGTNLYAAIRMLTEGDPLAGTFARGVLQAFQQTVPEGNRARLRSLLDLWDTVLLDRTGVAADPAVIAAARVQASFE